MNTTIQLLVNHVGTKIETMTDKIKQLNDLRKNMEILKITLDSLKKDLSKTILLLKNYEIIEEAIVENIRQLKKERVIALASQYKLSIEQLKKTREDIEYYHNIEKSLSKRIEESAVKYSISKHAHMRLKRYIQNHRVILTFDKSKKRNK